MTCKVNPGIRHLTFPMVNGGYVLTRGFVVVNTDSVQLQVTISMIAAGGVNAVLVTDHLPELSERERKRKKNGSHEESLMLCNKPWLVVTLGSCLKNYIT